MKIEILKPGKMTNSGRAVLRSMQNDSLPYLDLLIRESIQNSLDVHKDDAKHVKVDFITGKFDGQELDDRLEYVEFMKKVKTDEHKFIAIQDKNTVGLTGPTNHNELDSNDYGNLVSLVYELGKPQEKEGSGGSWGYGKSIYYGIGIGLVLFYSRIKYEGGYQERLAAAYVENERGDNPILPPAPGTKARTGIAWWGRDIGNGTTEVITDSNLIYEYLNIFGLEHYKEDETGTTIIIPFIDEEELLKKSYGPLQGMDSYYESLEHYLEVGIQRWYSPRLVENYSQIYKKPYLVSKVNETNVMDVLEDFFVIIQEMYKSAINKNYKYNDLNFKKEEIFYYKNRHQQFKSNKPLGTLIYTKINYEDLGMTHVYDPNNPHFLSGKAERHESEKHSNKPLITFTRLPGMLVNYEEHGDWANKIEETDIDEYIIGLFVLNSLEPVYLNGLFYEDLNEYVRQGEKADHSTWDDPRMDANKSDQAYKLVNVMKIKVRNAIRNEFKSDVESDSRISRNSSQISKILSDKILPSYGFGDKASKPTRRERRKREPGEPRGIRKTRNLRYSVVEDLIKINENAVTIPINIIAKDLNKIELDILLLSGNETMNLSRYEKDTDHKSPFEIKFTKIIDSMSKIIDEDLYETENKTTDKNTVYGQMITLKERFQLESFMLVVVIKTEDIKTVPIIRLKERID